MTWERGQKGVTHSLTPFPQSMRELGDWEHPRVKTVMDKAIEQIRASTKVYGPDVMAAVQVSQLLKQGGESF